MIFISVLNASLSCFFFFVSLQIHVHCNTSVCKPKPGDNCEPRCLRKSKYKIRETQEKRSLIVELSSDRCLGGVYFHTERDISASAVKTVRPEATVVSSKAIEIVSA